MGVSYEGKIGDGRLDRRGIWLREGTIKGRALVVSIGHRREKVVCLTILLKLSITTTTNSSFKRRELFSNGELKCYE